MSEFTKSNFFELTKVKTVKSNQFQINVSSNRVLKFLENTKDIEDSFLVQEDDKIGYSPKKLRIGLDQLIENENVQVFNFSKSIVFSLVSGNSATPCKSVGELTQQQFSEYEAKNITLYIKNENNEYYIVNTYQGKITYYINNNSIDSYDWDIEHLISGLIDDNSAYTNTEFYIKSLDGTSVPYYIRDIITEEKVNENDVRYYLLNLELLYVVGKTIDKKSETETLTKFEEEFKKLYNELLISDKTGYIFITAIKNGIPSKISLEFSVGTDVDALRTVSLQNLFGQYINDTKMTFSADGLEVSGASISIYQSVSDEKVPVFVADKEGNLTIKGTVYADDGYFSGTLNAATGTFSGTITAAAGNIGGFIINEHSISSEDDSLVLKSSYVSNGITYPSSIEVQNIEIGTGAQIKEYLQLGNLKLWNPNNENSKNKVIDLSKEDVINIYSDELEQGTINAGENNLGENLASNTRIRTKFLPVDNTLEYNIDLNISFEGQIFANIWQYTNEKEYIARYQTGVFAKDNNTYTIKINTFDSNCKFIRIVLFKKIKDENNEYYTPAYNSTDPNEYFLVKEINSFKLLGGQHYFTLTNEGYLEGNNWSIKKEAGHSYVTARFGKLIAEDGEFSGTIYATDGVFSGSITASIINATTINTVNFVTEKVRAMGGAFIFKPTVEVEKVEQITDNFNNLLIGTSLEYSNKMTESNWKVSSSIVDLVTEEINEEEKYNKFTINCFTTESKDGSIYQDLWNKVKNDMILNAYSDKDFIFSCKCRVENFEGKVDTQDSSKNGRMAFVITYCSNPSKSITLGGKYICKQNFSNVLVPTLNEWTDIKIKFNINKFYDDNEVLLFPNQFIFRIFCADANVVLDIKDMDLKFCESGDENKTVKQLYAPAPEDFGYKTDNDITNFLDNENKVIRDLTSKSNATITYGTNGRYFTVSGDNGYAAAGKNVLLDANVKYKIKVYAHNQKDESKLCRLGISSYQIFGDNSIKGSASETIEGDKTKVLEFEYIAPSSGEYLIRFFPSYVNEGAETDGEAYFYNFRIFAESGSLATITYNNENNFNEYLESYGENPILSFSNLSIRYGKLIKLINKNQVIACLAPTDLNSILQECYSMTIFGEPNNHEIIAINSDNNKAGNILPPRALIMEKFSDLKNNSGTSSLDYSVNLLLGDLSTLKDLDDRLKYITGYGLYADNVFLHGSLMTSTGDHSSYAGINTQKTYSFNKANWVDDNTEEYNNEKIIFWGGANSLAEEDIQKSPFIITDKGSIFASRGIFKGAVISDSLLTRSVIKTPILYGTGKQPSLKIYDTGNGGISFYKLVNELDAESTNETNDIKTMSIDSEGFYHYYNQEVDYSKRLESGSLNAYTGENTDSLYRLRLKDYSGVGANTSYIINSNFNYYLVHYFDSNKEHLSQSGWIDNNEPFQTPINTKYIRFILANQQQNLTDTIDLKDVEYVYLTATSDRMKKQFIRFWEKDDNSTLDTADIHFIGDEFITGNTTLSNTELRHQINGNTPAIISLKGLSDNNVEGYLKIIYGNRGISVNSENIQNTGGLVINEGETQFVADIDALPAEKQNLKYNYNNGYYRLYVNSI